MSRELLDDGDMYCLDMITQNGFSETEDVIHCH